MKDRGERQLRAGKLVFEAESELMLSLDRARATLPYPRHGYGGHRLVVSADERYLALHLYSGQSEEGWELFELPSLVHLASLPYFHGEGTACVFSPGARWLATFTSYVPLVRGTDEEFESIELYDWNTYDALSFVSDDTLQLRMPWGEIRTIALPVAAAIVASPVQSR